MHRNDVRFGEPPCSHNRIFVRETQEVEAVFDPDAELAYATRRSREEAAASVKAGSG